MLRGTEVVYSHPLVEPLSGLPKKLRVGWRGARVKDRTRRLRWDGSLHMDRGRILAAEGWAFDDPTEGIVEWNEESVRWVSQTSGDWDGIALEIAGDAETTLTFTSAPATFSLRLDELADKDEIVRPGITGVSSEVRISRDDEDRAPRDASFTFQDPEPLKARPHTLLRPRYPIRRRNGMVQSGVCTEGVILQPILASLCDFLPRMWMSAWDKTPCYVKSLW